MKYFVICGETSGDLHLSILLGQVKKIDKTAEFVGVCGEKSESIGVKKLLDITEINVMGLGQALMRYKVLKQKLIGFVDFIEKEKIKNVILIDYGGFNLGMVKLLRERFKKEINIFYYIPPKLWVWGKKRIHKLKLVDHIMVIFPWEKEFYDAENTPSVYFGNPLVDEVFPRKTSGEKILLLPGSRRQELDMILPVMNKIVANEQNREFVLKVANSRDEDRIRIAFVKYSNIEITVTKSLQELSAECKGAIATSGTVILELALLYVPTVLIYKMSKMNEIIFNTLIRFPYLGLPNIALKKFLFPELIQNNCESVKIMSAYDEIVSKDLSKDFDTLRDILGSKDIINQFAKYVVNESRS